MSGKPPRRSLNQRAIKLCHDCHKSASVINGLPLPPGKRKTGRDPKDRNRKITPNISHLLAKNVATYSSPLKPNALCALQPDTPSSSSPSSTTTAPSDNACGSKRYTAADGDAPTAAATATLYRAGCGNRGSAGEWERADEYCCPCCCRTAGRQGRLDEGSSASCEDGRAQVCLSLLLSRVRPFGSRGQAEFRSSLKSFVLRPPFSISFLAKNQNRRPDLSFSNRKHALTLQLHTAHILSAHASLEQKAKAIQDLREQKNK